MRNQTRQSVSRQRREVLLAARRYETIKHMPRALVLANARAERWRQRYLEARKQRDEARAALDRVHELYSMWMNWNGGLDKPGASSPRQRKELADALGIDHDA